MAFLKLPNELMVAIAKNLDSLSEINAFAQTDRRCYSGVNRQLYLSGAKDTGTLRLPWAVERNCIGAVEWFIEVGAIDDPDGETIEALLKIAAFRGYIDIVTLLVKHGAKVCDRMELYCQTALGEAIKGSQIEVVDFLLNDRADLNGTFANGQKAIHIAARSGNEQMMKLLLDHGIELYSLDQGKSSALQIAAMEGNLEALDALLEYGFDPNFVDGNGNTPIHGLGKSSPYNGTYGRSGYEKTITSNLLNHGANPYLKDKNGCMPLWIASYLGLDREVASLLKYGINPEGLNQNEKTDPVFSLEELEKIEKENSTNHSYFRAQVPLIHRNGTTPLCIAACMDHHYAVKVLLEYEASPNTRNQNGDTPLHLAALNQSSKLASLLIEKGASIDAKDGAGKTAFELALRNGGIDVIEEFFNAGASIETVDSTGVHPIFLALAYGHSNYGRSEMLPPHIVDTGQQSSSGYQHNWAHWCPCCPGAEEDQCALVIGWFLDRGTDVNTRDLLGRTMLHQTTFQNCADSVRFLLEKGADPMVKDSFGQVPLHMACSTRWDYSEEVFEMLLDGGCDPNCKDENGDTPLHIAARSCYEAGVRILRQDGRADFLARNNRGNTPMHEGMGVHGIADEETIFELRRAGTDLNLVNNEGKTVWDLARQNPNEEDWRIDTLSSEIPEEKSESECQSESERSDATSAESSGDDESEDDSDSNYPENEGR